MKSSLIIQSSEINFETYYKKMIKRKIAHALSSSMNSANNQGSPTASGGRFASSGGTQEIASPRGTLLFVKGKRPPARDGHTVAVHNGSFIVFGGDRHQMPFNDLFVLDLETEFNTAMGSP